MNSNRWIMALILVLTMFFPAFANASSNTLELNTTIECERIGKFALALDLLVTVIGALIGFGILKIPGIPIGVIGSIIALLTFLHGWIVKVLTILISTGVC